MICGSIQPGVPPTFYSEIIALAKSRGVQTLLRTILTREGCVVECASDGVQALQRCLSRRYDLILLDLAMPSASGLDVLRQLEEQGRADVLSRIIVVTAASLNEIANVRGVPVLRKPFDLGELRAAIRRVTGAELPSVAPVNAPPREEASPPR